jgi:hypothetical protein
MLRTLFRAAPLVVLAALLSAGTAQASTRVYVRFGPPPIYIEHRPPPPPGYYVWRPGYHRYYRTRYLWTRGDWVSPPYRHARWIPGRWHRENRGYFYVSGYWSR